MFLAALRRTGVFYSYHAKIYPTFQDTPSAFGLRIRSLPSHSCQISTTETLTRWAHLVRESAAAVVVVGAVYYAKSSRHAASSLAPNSSEHPVSSTSNYNVDFFSNQLDSTQPFTSSELRVDGVPISNSSEIQSSVISSGSNHLASSSSERGTNQLAPPDQTPFNPNICSEIEAKLPSDEDFLSFTEVCSQWRRGCSHIKWTTDPQFPSLMLSENRSSIVRNSFNFDQNKRYETEISAAREQRCFPSPDGMILTLTRDGTIHHLNLHSQDRKRLPRLHLSNETPAAGDWFYFIHKLMVFNRFPNDRIVMAIFGSRKQLAFVRLGEEEWKTVKNLFGVRDVALFEGQFYALRDFGTLVHIIFSRTNVAEAEFIAEGPKNSRIHPAVEIYLVASHMRSSLGDFSADLLGVFRYGHVFDRGRETKYFKVYKLDFNEQKWKRLKNLGNRAIFVGEGNSWSISASNFIHAKGNMIYYTDDYWRRPRESTSSGYEVGFFSAGDLIHIDAGEVTSSDSGEEVIHNEVVADNYELIHKDDDEEMIDRDLDEKVEADNEEVAASDEEVADSDEEMMYGHEEEVIYGHDVGVFSMARGLSRELLNLGEDNPSDSSRPIWVTSNFSLRFFSD